MKHMIWFCYACLMFKLVVLLTILFCGSAFGRVLSLDSRLLNDSNVYQTTSNPTNDTSLRLTGRYSDKDQVGRIYFETFATEKSLDNYGVSYMHQIISLFNGWKSHGEILTQQYVKKDLNLTDENINLVAGGVNWTKDFEWSDWQLTVTPETYLYLYSATSTRSDFRPAVAGDLTYIVNGDTRVLTGGSLGYNVSSDEDYSYFKMALYGGGAYDINDTNEVSATLTLGNTSYTNRYGATASVYANRKRGAQTFDRNESVSSVGLNLNYDNHLSDKMSVGGQLISYSQRSVSGLLDYNSLALGAWFTYYF
ncbi:MAG: hypothetical protein V4736_12925 [Bdellovibrionota bacterium]